MLDNGLSRQEQTIGFVGSRENAGERARESTLRDYGVALVVYSALVEQCIHHLRYDVAFVGNPHTQVVAAACREPRVHLNLDVGDAMRRTKARKRKGRRVKKQNRD